MQQTKRTRTETRLKLRLSIKAGFHKHKITNTNSLGFLHLYHANENVAYAHLLPKENVHLTSLVIDPSPKWRPKIQIS